LALADPERLIELIEGLGEIPPFEYLRAPQKGLVMIRVRGENSSLVFNLGEALVTRCSVVINGCLGHAYILGDEPEKCLTAALACALAQDIRYQKEIERIVLALEEEQGKKRREELSKTLQTRVDFFTLVRGEDAD
jgi:alpha-D-ribose 1-methylphosphonate 5-triphosphate synthase subunit PhnG